MKLKVLVSDPLAENAIEEMRAKGLDVSVHVGLKSDALCKIVSDFDVLAVRSQTKVTKEVIEAAKKLKLIVRAGVGLDNVDAEAAKKRNIRIENTPHATTISVAEHTFALMLSLARRIPQAYASLKGGDWNRKAFQGVELKGKVLAIVGLGRIGQEVAKRAKSFGMQVEANDRDADVEIAEALEIEHRPLKDILKEADFVSLHLPLAQDTYHLFNREILYTIKRGAYLINASRGGIVDEVALAEALKEGHLSGVALDVFEVEPPQAENPLLKMPQVIAVPHLGASTNEGQARAGHEAAHIIIEFAKQYST